MSSVCCGECAPTCAVVSVLATSCMLLAFCLACMSSVLGTTCALATSVWFHCTLPYFDSCMYVGLENGSLAVFEMDEG